MAGHTSWASLGFRRRSAAHRSAGQKPLGSCVTAQAPDDYPKTNWESVSLDHAVQFDSTTLTCPQAATDQRWRRCRLTPGTLVALPDSHDADPRPRFKEPDPDDVA